MPPGISKMERCDTADVASAPPASGSNMASTCTRATPRNDGRQHSTVQRGQLYSTPTSLGRVWWISTTNLKHSDFTLRRNTLQNMKHSDATIRLRHCTLQRVTVVNMV